jgi:hypothetical protein
MKQRMFGDSAAICCEHSSNNPTPSSGEQKLVAEVMGAGGEPKRSVA